MNEDINDLNQQKMEDIIGSNFQELSEESLSDVRESIDCGDSIFMPISKLSSLGVGVSSLIAPLRIATKGLSISSGKLFHLVTKNKGSNPVQGVYMGTMKGNAFKGQIPSAHTPFISIDPATIMIAVALFSIEKQLGEISAMQRQILSFLETEKMSEIEADVETLSNIINKYKHNWDNENYTASNYKMVLDIQRTARKNMISYQRMVNEIVSSNQTFIAQSKVKSTLDNLLKKFKYYRLSLFAFTMASLVEIMLSGNFKEEYIFGIKSEIERQTEIYRNMFDRCYFYLKNMSFSSIESNVLKGLGNVSKAAGEFASSLSFLKKGTVDKFFIDSGNNMNNTANEINESALKIFVAMCNPNTKVFVDKMNDMIKIFNYTSDICFDKDNIYLIANNVGVK